jgi:hypothetical protein
MGVPKQPFKTTPFAKRSARALAAIDAGGIISPL